jgi:RND family efflux transporter MFP subunit
MGGSVCLLLVLFLMTALFASGCQERAEFVPPPPPEVTFAVPLQQPVQEYFEAPGQTRAVKVVELRARVEGYLKEIHFQDGELVSEGQLLFVIDQAPYQATLASANATLAKAEAQLQLSEQELKRTQSLAARQVTTESDLDIREAERSSAAADVALAEAALEQAQLNMQFTQIRAPFAGRMGRHLIDVGNLVQKEMTLLTTLESVDPIHAYFNVSESDLLRFREMQRDGTLKITDSDPLPVELALGDAGEFAFTGQLDFREFGINPETGTTQRRAVFPNADGRLIPGLFVRIRVAVGDPVERFLVEERAISSDQRGAYLLVVDDQNVVQYRPVELGLLLNGLRAIESGLNTGERVIVNGLQRARPSAKVTPAEVEMGASLSDSADSTASGSATVAAGVSESTGSADNATNGTAGDADAALTNDDAADPTTTSAPQNE